MIQGAEHCKAWARKEWRMKLANPARALLWTLIVRPIAGLTAAGMLL